MSDSQFKAIINSILIIFIGVVITVVGWSVITMLQAEKNRDAVIKACT